MPDGEPRICTKQAGALVYGILPVVHSGVSFGPTFSRGVALTAGSEWLHRSWVPTPRSSNTRTSGHWNAGPADGPAAERGLSDIGSGLARLQSEFLPHRSRSGRTGTPGSHVGRRCTRAGSVRSAGLSDNRYPHSRYW